ncbi:MAG: 2-oxoglutarate dehydrogenase complex dihydrolipoyllysine-residue succinyltransferase [Thermodesulfobacteriota bacterium]
MANIVVPSLGDSVIEATIIKWVKNEGDAVKIGETILELETEKANFEVAAETNGILKSIAKKADEDVEVGDILGEIEAVAVSDTADEPKAAKPELENKKGEVTQKPPKEETKIEKKTETKITPVAKKIAEQNSVDISNVKPSGPSGRIIKEDIEQHIQARSETPKTDQDSNEKVKSLPSDIFPSLSELYSGRENRVKMSRRRRTIARRLKEAQETAAILSTFNEVDMSAVMDLRKRRKDDFKEKYGVNLGFSSFFVKASIGALKAFPEINAEIEGEEIVYKNYFDIGIAVGAEGGLVVPVLREADRKSFAQIEKEIKELAQKAQDGSLTIDELMGGTFTITNGGVFGSLMSTPIINPPQVGILGLHKIQERPVAIDGEVVIRPMMYTALSYDHRIVDGKEAVQFLVKIKELIEDPESLLIEG